jgi:amidophosphoribosyltransferase
MCGIVGVVSQTPVNQLLYDALLLLQHRGQDAAGIATNHSSMFSMYKANGLVRDVFRTRNMRSLQGNTGIGHCRYPTAGSSSEEEAQPFYVNAPFGITLAHNGNLTNQAELKEALFRNDRRHINTNSDSEVLLNVLAHEIQEAANGYSLDAEAVFRAVGVVHRRVRGAYAVVAQIAGHGMLAFRDPYGIRPLCLGVNEGENGVEYMVASESVALEGIGFRFVRDIAPGEAIFIGEDGVMHERQCAENPSLNPCAFEYVYLARPDSVIDGASVYATRLKMGEYLADKIRKEIPVEDIDVVMPIPDSSRPAAIQLALKLGVEYREGFIKNRYIGRTFIMPGQGTRSGRAQGVLRLGRAAGAVPERLRHRHADPRRADRLRPHRRGSVPGNHRRPPGLPGHRRAETFDLGREPGADQFRGLVLRRRLHHRRRDPGLSREAGDGAP